MKESGLGQPRVFVSHSNLDNGFTERFVDDLRKGGVDVWVDFEKIESGNFALSINEGLGTCEWLVLVLTPNAVASSWVSEEVNSAVNLKHKKRLKGVIPVLAVKCEEGSIPAVWDSLHTYDAIRDYEHAINGVLKAVGATVIPEVLSESEDHVMPVTLVVPRKITNENSLQMSPEAEIEFERPSLSEVIGTAFKHLRPTKPKEEVPKASVPAVHVNSPEKDHIMSSEAEVKVGPPSVSEGLGAFLKIFTQNSKSRQVLILFLLLALVLGISLIKIVIGLPNADSGSKKSPSTMLGLAKSSWPKFHGNSDNSGLGQSQDPFPVAIHSNIGNLKMVTWEFTFGGMLTWGLLNEKMTYSSPTIGIDGTLYIGGNDNYVYSIDGRNGKVNWAFRTGGEVHSSPTVGADGTIFVGSDDKNVYAIDCESGKMKWAFPTEAKVYSSPTIGDDGTIYVGSNDGRVYAINCSTGKPKWMFETNSEITSSPAFGLNGIVYIAASQNKSGDVDKWTGMVYAIDGYWGTKVWEFPTSGEINSSPTYKIRQDLEGPGTGGFGGSSGTVYIGCNDKNIYAIDADTGEQKWAFLTGGPVRSTPAIGHKGIVYVGSDDKNIYAVDGATGKKKWSYVTEAMASSSVAIDLDDTLYVRDGNYLYALFGSDGKERWKCRLGNGYSSSSGWPDSSPALGSNRTVFVGTGQNSVCAISYHTK